MALDLGVLFLGLGHVLAVFLTEGQTSARIFRGNFFGSFEPISSHIEFLSLVAFSLALALWAFSSASAAQRKFLVGALATWFALLAAEGLCRLRVAIAPPTDGYPTMSTKAWRVRYASNVNEDGFRDINQTLVAKALALSGQE